jgi:hypothetical protein
MAGETVKAVLMIAMFGLFVALINIPRIQRMRLALHRAASEFWRSLATPPRALQPIPVKAKRRNV